jgi:cation:H+ antiporter
VVAFGTSAPELVVSLISSIQGKSMIAVGNVVGSNICNIALVLGLSAVLNPIKSDPTVVRRDIPIMLAVSLYLLLLTFNSILGRIEGATLFIGIILYTFMNYYQAKKETAGAAGIESELKDIGFVASRPKQLLMIAAGIAGVVAGAQIVVNNAVLIMTILGVSEKFIGLTIVAFGTSLPELAASVVAAIRGEMDISIGNLVGSNVFNIMSVLGLAALVRPIPIPGGFIESGLWIDYLVMIFTSFLPWLMMRKDFTVKRSDGVILLLCYGGYLAYLIIKA